MSRETRETLLAPAFLYAALAHFLHNLAFSLLLHFPGYLKTLGANELLIGIVFGTTGATAIAARPVLGRWMDRHGRKRVIVIAGLAHVLVCGSYLAIRSLGPIAIVTRVVHGGVEAALFTALFTLAADLVPASRRIEGIALFGVSGMLPVSLGALFGDFALSYGGYRLVFFAATLFAAAGAAVSFALTAPPVPPHDRPARGYFDVFFQRDLLPLWMIELVFATTLTGYFVFLKTYLMTTHVGTMGSFFIAYSISAIALRLGFGHLPDRIGPKRVLFPSLVAVALGLFLLAYADRPWHLVLAGVIAGLGHGYAFPVLLGITVSRSHPSERGVVLGLVTAFIDAGNLIGGPLLGGAVRLFGYPAMYTMVAGMLIASTGAFAAWDQRRPCETGASQ